MWSVHTHAFNGVPNNNNNIPPRLAGLTYPWGSVASQIPYPLWEELAGEARCQPEPCTER